MADEMFELDDEKKADATGAQAGSVSDLVAAGDAKTDDAVKADDAKADDAKAEETEAPPAVADASAAEPAAPEAAPAAEDKAPEADEAADKAEDKPAEEAPAQPELSEVHPEAQAAVDLAPEIADVLKDVGNKVTPLFEKFREADAKLHEIEDEAKVRFAHVRQKATELVAALESWFKRG